MCNESAPEFGNQCSKAVFPTACSMQCKYRDNGPLASMPLAIPLSTLLLLTSVNLQIVPSFTGLYPTLILSSSKAILWVVRTTAELKVSQSEFFQLWEVLKGVDMKRVDEVYEQISLGLMNKLKIH